MIGAVTLKDVFKADVKPGVAVRESVKSASD